MISIAIFVWLYGFELQPATEAEMPLFSCNSAGGCYSATDWNDIQYPTYFPRYSSAVGTICFPNGGYYTVNLQLGMMPGAESDGTVLLKSESTQTAHFLLAWTAGTGYSLQGNSVIVATQPGECFRLKYSSTARATINPDQRATKLTIHKLQ